MKFKQTVQLVKPCSLSEPVLTQKPDFVQPESFSIVNQKTINPMITKQSGQLLDPVKVHKSRPQQTQTWRPLKASKKCVSGCVLSCSKYPQCCDRSSCGRLITGILARAGCKSLGGVHSKGGSHPTFQNEAFSYQVSYDSKWLCESHKEPFPQRGIDEKRKVGSRNSSCPVIPSLSQLPVSSSQTKQQMEPILDLSQLNRYLNTGTFKMGTPETI